MDKLEGLIKGDRQIVGLIYEDHLEDVVQWIVQRGGDRSIALDIFQDALEVIITASLKPDFYVNATFGAYLFGICKYKWLGETRHRQKSEQVRNDIRDTHIDEIDINVTPALETEVLFQRTLTSLSPICQRLMTMIKSNLSTAHIVQELDFSSANTMYRRKFACLKSWRTLIENDTLYINWKAAING